MKISKTGYKKNSKDKNQPSLLIPSNNITMKGVEFPVLGTDNTGYSQMMYPGADYTFPGNYVYEKPMNWLDKYQSKTTPGSVKNNSGPRISNMPTSVVDGKIEIAYDGTYIYVRKPGDDPWKTLDANKSKEFVKKYAPYIPQTLSQKEESDRAFKARRDAEKRKDDAHKAALQKSADEHRAAEIQRAKELTRQARIEAQQKAQEKGWFDSAWDTTKSAYESLPDVSDVVNTVKGAYEALPDVEDVLGFPSYVWNYKIPENDIPVLRSFGELSPKEIWQSFKDRYINQDLDEGLTGESSMEDVSVLSEPDLTSGTSDMQQLKKSRAKYGPQRLPARKDSRGNMLPAYQPLNNSDSLARFSYTFNNDVLGADTLPPTHFVTPKIKEIKDNPNRPKKWDNAFAVGDFLRDADITENQFYHPDKYYVGSSMSTLYNSELGIQNKKLISAGNTLTKDPEKYWAVYKWDPKNPQAAWVRYMKTKDINSQRDELLKQGWHLDMPVSQQHKFDDVDWDGKGSDTGYQADSRWIPLKKGATNIISQRGIDHTFIPQGNKKGQNQLTYNKFSGGSITFLWTDPETNEKLAATVAGSVSDMKQYGEKLKRDYNIKEGDLEIIYHDTGSYSAKPAAKDGTLYYDQWKDFNVYNKGYSGAALIVPTQDWLDNYNSHKKEYGGIVPGRYRNPEGNWLNKYQSKTTAGQSKTAGFYNPFQYAFTDPERMQTMLQFPGYYPGPTVDIIDKSPFIPVQRPGVHGSMKTVYVNPKTGASYETPETTAAELASSEIARSNNVDPIGLGILAASGVGPAIRTAGAALPYLDAPLTIGSKVFPAVTANNILGAAGAAHATQQILDPSSDLRTNPNAENILMTGLDFVGLGIAKGTYQGFEKFRKKVNNLQNSFLQTNLGKAVTPFSKKITRKTLEEASDRKRDIWTKDIPKLQEEGDNLRREIFRRELNPSIRKYLANKPYTAGFGDSARSLNYILNSARARWINNNLNIAKGLTSNNGDLVAQNISPFFAKNRNVNNPILTSGSLPITNLKNGEKIIARVTPSGAQIRAQLTTDVNGRKIVNFLDESKDLPEIDKQYINTLQSNIQHIEETIPGAKVFGSSRGVAEGNLPHLSSDYDILITESDYIKHVKDKYPKKDVVGSANKHDISGNLFNTDDDYVLDFNVIHQNPDGTARPVWIETGFGQKSSREIELFRQAFPEEFFEASRQSILTGKPLKINKTPKELIEKLDPAVKGIIDAYESQKTKHVSRIDGYINYGDIEKVAKAQESFVRSIVGSKGSIGHQFNTSAFNDIENNKKVLEEIGFIGDMNIVAKDPKRMQLALNDFYINSTVLTRNVFYDNTNRNLVELSFKKWNAKNPQGSLKGAGLNHVELGTPYDINSSDYVIGNKQIGLNLDTSNVNNYVQSIKKQTDGSVVLDKDELEIISGLLDQSFGEGFSEKVKKVIPPDNWTMDKLINLHNRNEFSDIIYMGPDGKLSNDHTKYDIFNKAVEKSLGVRSVKGEDFGNSKFVATLGDFNEKLDILAYSLAENMPRLKSITQRKNNYSTYAGNSNDFINTVKHTIDSQNFKQIEGYVKGGHQRASERLKILAQEKQMLEAESQRLLNMYSKKQSSRLNEINKQIDLLGREASDLSTKQQELAETLKRISEIRLQLAVATGAVGFAGGLGYLSYTGQTNTDQSNPYLGDFLNNLIGQSVPQKKYGGWLDKYQSETTSGQYIDMGGKPYMYPSGEPDTYNANYSAPVVEITPNWTEAELERNRLRDKYIADDKKAFRHWYDKLGYDRKNVEKRAKRFANDTLAKTFLKGDISKLGRDQLNIIKNSAYANRLEPGVWEKFAEGVSNPGFNMQTVENVLAPLTYPLNVVKGSLNSIEEGSPKMFVEGLKGNPVNQLFRTDNAPVPTSSEDLMMATLNLYSDLALDPMMYFGDAIFGAAGRGIKEVKSGAKSLANLADNVIYPTRAYRAEGLTQKAADARKAMFNSEESKIYDQLVGRGDKIATKSLDDLQQYLVGNKGRAGLLNNEDMLITEYKVPFWKKPVTANKKFVDFKQNVQGVDLNPNEYIIPGRTIIDRFLYPRRTNVIKGVPKNLTDEFIEGSYPMSYHSFDYTLPGYKYIEDQIRAVTGHDLPLFNPNYNIVHPRFNWKQPQFAPREGVGTFTRVNHSSMPRDFMSTAAPKGNMYGGWLDQYQTRGEVKTYASDPQYFDNRAIYHDDPRFNDVIRSKVYAGTHGWDPSTNSLVKLKTPVKVPESIKEMSTADWGKKTQQQRIESNTPAGKATRKAVAAQGMKDMVQNPALYVPGAIAAGVIAGPAIASSVGSALNAPLTIGSTVIPEVTAGNLINLGFGVHGANMLANDYNTGYYSSDAPLMDKIARGTETGINIAFTPGMTNMFSTGIKGAKGLLTKNPGKYFNPNSDPLLTSPLPVQPSKSLQEITNDIDALNSTIKPRSEATTDDMQDLLERLRDINKSLEEHIDPSETSAIDDIFNQMDINFDPSITDNIDDMKNQIDPDIFKSMKDKLKGIEQNEEAIRQKALDDLAKQVPEEFSIQARALPAKVPKTQFYTDAEIQAKIDQYNAWMNAQSKFREGYKSPLLPEELQREFEMLFPDITLPTWDKTFTPEQLKKLMFQSPPLYADFVGSYKNLLSPKNLKSYSDDLTSGNIWNSKLNSITNPQRSYNDALKETSNSNAWFKRDPKSYLEEMLPVFRHMFPKNKTINLEELTEEQLHALAKQVNKFHLDALRLIKNLDIHNTVWEAKPKGSIQIPFKPEQMNKYGGSTGWLDKYQDGGEEMPFGLPLKSSNPGSPWAYESPTANGYLLPDPNRPELLNTGATEYKMGVDDVTIPTVVNGQYMNPDDAYYRYMLTGEKFKPMVDPSSYSNFYDMINQLRLMQNKKKGGPISQGMGYFKYINGYKGVSS